MKPSRYKDPLFWFDTFLVLSLAVVTAMVADILNICAGGTPYILHV